MHVFAGLIAILVAAFLLYNRFRQAANTTEKILDMGNEVRLAARRFGFKRKANVHPVETVDDPRLTAAGLLHATGLQAGPLTESELGQIHIQIQSVFDTDLHEAKEISVFGSWLVTQCTTPAQAIDRLAKQTFKLGGDATFKDIQTMLARIYASGNAARQDALTYALSDIARVYGRN